MTTSLKSQIWETAKLGHLCSITTGDKDVNEGTQNGQYPFFTCAEEVFSFATYSFDGDAILIAGNGNFNVKRYSGKFEAYQRTYVLQNFKLNYPFLFYYIFYKLEDITRDNRGTTVRYIRIGNLFDYVVKFPALSEQKIIVVIIEEMISDLDNAVENLKKAREQLKIYRHAVLESAFKGNLTNKNFKKGELPKNWKNVRLGDVCASVEYGTAAKSKKIGKIPVLRMGNIQGGKFDWTDLVYTDDEAEIEKYSLRKNDVLFNRTNSPELVGKTAIYRGERAAIFAGYLIRINRKESLVDASYLTYYLNSHDARKYGDSVKSFGVNQSNINGTKLKSYPLPLAPLDEQRIIVEEIESRFSVCEKLEETIEGSLNQTKTLRQSILKQAFEGKLTEQWRKKHKDLISGENSAEALLKKIKAEKEALQAKPKGKKKHD